MLAQTKYTANVISYSDYYPPDGYRDGMQMPGRNGSTSEYRYGFNGEEKIDEVGKGEGNHYDLGFRHYDVRIARMLSRDPREAEYPWQSTYAYYKNNPVNVVDVSGAGGGGDTTYTSSSKGTGNVMIIILSPNESFVKSHYENLENTQWDYVVATSIDEGRKYIEANYGDKEISNLDIRLHGCANGMVTDYYSDGSYAALNLNELNGEELSDVERGNLNSLKYIFSKLADNSKCFVAACSAGGIDGYGAKVYDLMGNGTATLYMNVVRTNNLYAIKNIGKDGYSFFPVVNQYDMMADANSVEVSYGTGIVFWNSSGFNSIGSSNLILTTGGQMQLINHKTLLRRMYFELNAVFDFKDYASTISKINGFSPVNGNTGGTPQFKLNAGDWFYFKLYYSNFLNR